MMNKRKILIIVSAVVVALTILALVLYFTIGKNEGNNGGKNNGGNNNDNNNNNNAPKPIGFSPVYSTSEVSMEYGDADPKTCDLVDKQFEISRIDDRTVNVKFIKYNITVPFTYSHTVANFDFNNGTTDFYKNEEKNVFITLGLRTCYWNNKKVYSLGLQNEPNGSDYTSVMSSPQ